MTATILKAALPADRQRAAQMAHRANIAGDIEVALGAERDRVVGFLHLARQADALGVSIDLAELIHTDASVEDVRTIILNTATGDV